MDSKRVPFHVTVTPKTRQILDRVAAGLSDGGRPPLGEIIDEMTKWYEEINDWPEVEDAIRENSAQKRQDRKARDRERKRKA
jgi:hypothetical protein